MLELLLFVNVQTKQLCVLNAQNVKQPPIACYPVAVAKNKDNTPDGAFTITRVVENPSFVSCRTGVNHGQGFLGDLAIVTNKETSPGCSYAIHGTNDDSSIGTEISDGCTRLRNKDVNHLKTHYLPYVVGGYVQNK